MMNVMPLYTDSALNWGWAGICLVAFAWFVVSARAGRCSTWQANRRKAVALALALVSLFPCISASDDAARIKSWNFDSHDDTASFSAVGGPHGDSERLTALVRLLEVLESCQAAIAHLFSLLLALFALVAALRLNQQECPSPWRAGRSPPAASFA
jgi:hypothetical protein